MVTPFPEGNEFDLGCAAIQTLDRVQLPNPPYSAMTSAMMPQTLK